MQPTKEAVALTPETNEALKALGWEGHEFKKCDWCLAFGESASVLNVDSDYLDVDYGLHGYRMLREIATPLLHWEDDIEPILRGLGYEVEVYGIGIYGCNIWKEPYGKPVNADGLSTRQLAMMRAVIALAKEVGK